MPISSSPVHSKALIFLSSNTQDFIEVIHPQAPTTTPPSFLSSNTQDFIEVTTIPLTMKAASRFLSSNTQDFIEVSHQQKVA